MRIRFTPRAYCDLENIDTENPAVGRSIFAAIDRTLELLVLMPYLGRPTDMPLVRTVPIPRYPYRIFYRVKDDTIEILTVFASRQNPDKITY